MTNRWAVIGRAALTVTGLVVWLPVLYVAGYAALLANSSLPPAYHRLGTLQIREVSEPELPRVFLAAVTAWAATAGALGLGLLLAGGIGRTRARRRWPARVVIFVGVLLSAAVVRACWLAPSG